MIMYYTKSGEKFDSLINHGLLHFKWNGSDIYPYTLDLGEKNYINTVTFVSSFLINDTRLMK